MKLITSLLLVLCFGHAFARTQSPLQIMDQVDHLYRSKKSFANVQMTIKNPRYERSLKMKIWSEGMVNTLIEITFPNKENGTKTLKKNTQVWNYLPKVDQVVSVPPSMMMSNWMGSDFTNDDLVKQTTLVSHYQGRFVPCTSKSPNELCIELLPKTKTVSVWGKIVLVVAQKDHFPLRQEFYNESQTLIRTFNYSDRRKIQRRDVPTTIQVVMKSSPQRTILKYDDIDFNAAFDDSKFSETLLRRK